MIAAQLGPATLRVVLDLRNPFSYLALGPTRALGEELGIEIDWLPLAGKPLNAPTEPAPDDDRGVRHRRSRALALARDIATYAEAQGLSIRDYYRAPDTDLAYQAWLWLRARDPARLASYLEGLFRGYWAGADGLDPAQPEAILELLDEIGAPRREFETWSAAEGEKTATALAEALREEGLFQAPGFVVEDEVFYGRQHLPMIRWILGGRAGPVPI